MNWRQVLAWEVEDVGSPENLWVFSYQCFSKEFRHPELIGADEEGLEGLSAEILLIRALTSEQATDIGHTYCVENGRTPQEVEVASWEDYNKEFEDTPSRDFARTLKKVPSLSLGGVLSLYIDSF